MRPPQADTQIQLISPNWETLSYNYDLGSGACLRAPLLRHKGRGMNIREVRQLYARQILAVVGADRDKKLEKAFSAVPREHFLVGRRWHAVTPWAPHLRLQTNDPTLLYQDVVISLDPKRGVNNGSPSLHAWLMHRVGPLTGATVVHVGAGTGYFSAILAELVGKKGRVLAIEYDKSLAKFARENLRLWGNVEVLNADGKNCALPLADLIYVNFAVSRPAVTWIDNLKKGGRLLFPLGTPEAEARFVGRHAMHAVALLVRRRRKEFAAEALREVSFVFAEGSDAAVGASEERRLRKALASKGWQNVSTLYWKERAKGRCWYVAKDWALGVKS